MENYYIVIEGLEGSGKTTAIKTVLKTLTELGIIEIDFVREPGGTPLAEKLRQLVKYGIDEEKITDKTELLIFYAARVQLIENVIKPAMKKGRWVVSDRHDLSSQAYQGGGRGISHELIQSLRNILLNDFHPNLTLYLDIDPVLGLQRTLNNRSKLDRIEKESLDFFNKTRQRYLELVAKDKSIIAIDASKSLEIVQNNIYHVLSNWLKLRVNK